MFRVFDALKSADDRWMGSQPELQRVEVCAFSGYRASPSCASTMRVWSAHPDAPTRVCPYHRTSWLEPSTGQEVPVACRRGNETETSVLVLPWAIRAWYSGTFQQPVGLPVASCSEKGGIRANEMFAMESPVEGARYLLPPGQHELRLPLIMVNERAIGEVRCYLDGAPFSEEVAVLSQQGLRLTVGAHDVQCIGPTGEAAQARFRVLDSIDGRQ